MRYKLEVMGLSMVPFESRLLSEAEFDDVSDLRDAVFNAFSSDQVNHVWIALNGERRIVTNCAQFQHEYMQDMPTVAS
ncbi:hypothetical protein OR214_00029 [Ralstonia pickettii OR214]|jgi:hypothetical protein|uniref:Uncharacterized protein n=1 Tax=Ralstonia pickettii OR214 TaxID=1264675 RepID=R0E1U9_RALPI|nr:hypothetical protein OR214_00029 [Ralstonia pickettii OR214]